MLSPLSFNVVTCWRQRSSVQLTHRFSDRAHGTTLDSHVCVCAVCISAMVGRARVES
jgi:hypothetical protein